MAGFDHRVTTGFDARDMGMRKTLQKINQDTKRFGTQADRSFALASRSAKKYKNSLSALKKVAATGLAIGILSQGVRAVTTEFLSFDDSIVAATARFKDLKPGTEKAAKVMEELRKVAKRTGADTQFTATQAAKGLDFFARAGFTSAESMKVLRNQVDLATATGEDFARVADISSDLLGALGLNSENSAKKIANLKEMNAVFAVATNRANVTMEDLFETIKDTGPIAVAAGESYKSVIAMTATLASTGIKGTKAGTALKNMFTRLTKPTKDVSKGLDKIGLSTKDFIDKTGKMLPMTVNLVKIQKAMKKANLGSAESLGVWARITGLRATAGAINITKAMGEYQKTLDATSGAQAKMKAIADAMRKGLGVQFQILVSTLTDKFFTLFGALQKDGTFSFKAIIELVKSIDMKPIVEGTRLFVSALKTLWKIVKPLVPLLPALAAGMMAYNAATAIHISMMAGGFLSNMVRFARVLMLVAKTKGLATAAQWALNVAMTANPIGIVVVAIGVLVGALVLMAMHWNKVTAAFMRFTAWFDNPVIAGIGLIMAPFITVPILIARNWNTLVDIFKNVFSTISSWFQTSGRETEGWMGMWNGFLGTIKLVYNGIKKIMSLSGSFKVSDIFKKVRTATGDTPKTNEGVGLTSRIPGKDSTQREVFQSRTQNQNFKHAFDINLGNFPGGSSVENKSFAPNTDLKFAGVQ
jgi:TP901 family phage tail tape measure protein